MNKVAIYIDKNLPGYSSLLSRFKTLKYDVVELSKASVVLKYAHSDNRDLQPLEDFLLNYNTIKHKKTLFFCWYNYISPNHSIFFSDYPGLFAKKDIRILQLPYNYNEISVAIEELNQIDYAK